MEPIVSDWREHGYGITFDTFYCSHLVWADNIFILASSREQLTQMTSTLLDALLVRHLDLKRNDATFIKGVGSDDFDTSTSDLQVPHGSSFVLKYTDFMCCLGVYLDRFGSTQSSITYREAQATKCFFKHRTLLTSYGAGVKCRLLAYASSLRATFLYNCGGWHVTADLIAKAITWENCQLRRIFCMRRADIESRMQYNKRTASRIDKFFADHRIPRIHHCIIKAVHTWAGRAFMLPSPVTSLLLCRTARSWNEFRYGNALIDPLNTTRWRHRKPGVPNAWET